MLLFTLLTACGSSPAPSSGLPEEWSGTYAGAQGTVMTLVSDGTARIGHASSAETIDMDSSWDFADDVITVHCKACGYEFVCPQALICQTGFKLSSHNYYFE